MTAKPITSGQKKQLTRVFEDCLEKLGLTSEEAQCLLMRGGEMQTKCTPILVALSSGEGLFSALVEYMQPAYETLKAAFNWVNESYRNAKFTPIDRCKNVDRITRKVTFEYLHVNRRAKTYEVLAEMDRLGLRPATYEELLAFARQFPDEQRKFPIVALGSVALIVDHERVSYLYGDDDVRDLCLHWVGGAWYGHCRFLAVRK